MVHPAGIAVDYMGNIFVTDAKQGKVFKYVLSHSASICLCLSRCWNREQYCNNAKLCRPTYWPLLSSANLYVRFQAKWANQDNYSDTRTRYPCCPCRCEAAYLVCQLSRYVSDLRVFSRTPRGRTQNAYTTFAYSLCSCPQSRCGVAVRVVSCNSVRNFYTGLAVNLNTFDLLVADSRTNAKESAALYRVRCANIGTPNTHLDCLFKF